MKPAAEARAVTEAVLPAAFDLSAAARYVGLGSSESMRYLVRTKRVVAVKVGRRILIRRQDLDRFLEANVVE